jgi:hypothetical protein
VSLSDRDRLIQLVQTTEDVGGATALLARSDSRYVPRDVRERITRVRQELSLIFGEMMRELRATAEDV